MRPRLPRPFPEYPQSWGCRPLSWWGRTTPTTTVSTSVWTGTQLWVSCPRSRNGWTCGTDRDKGRWNRGRRKNVFVTFQVRSVSRSGNDKRDGCHEKGLGHTGHGTDYTDLSGKDPGGKISSGWRELVEGSYRRKYREPREALLTKMRKQTYQSKVGGKRFGTQGPPSLGYSPRDDIRVVGRTTGRVYPGSIHRWVIYRVPSPPHSPLTQLPGSLPSGRQGYGSESLIGAPCKTSLFNPPVPSPTRPLQGTISREDPPDTPPPSSMEGPGSPPWTSVPGCFDLRVPS